MALYPSATQRPVVNHSGPRDAHLGFVVHVQVGDGSCYNEFDTPTSQASSHFWISKAGGVEQYVDTDLVAWAEMAGNGSYISCEFEGLTTEAMTAQQMAAGALLIAWCATQDRFPLTPVDHGGHGVTTHCHYPSGDPDPAWGDHPCPGPVRLAQTPQLIAMAAASTHGTTEELTTMFDLVAIYPLPAAVAAADDGGLTPCVGYDAKCNSYAFNTNGAAWHSFADFAIDPAKVVGGVAGGRPLPDGGILFAYDDGHQVGAEWKCSTFVLRQR